MNINIFNSVQDIKLSKKLMKKTMRCHARTLIYLKLLKIKWFSRRQNSINWNNIESIISWSIQANVQKIVIDKEIEVTWQSCWFERNFVYVLKRFYFCFKWLVTIKFKLSNENIDQIIVSRFKDFIANINFSFLLLICSTGIFKKTYSFLLI